MNRRSSILILALFIGFIAIFAYCLARHEPAYEGKPLSKWLRELAVESSVSQDKPVCAVRAIGTNALPYLTAVVRASDPAWKRAVMAFNAKQRLIHIAVTPASVARFDAVQGYRVMGTVAKGSVPELVHYLEREPSPKVRCSIAQALGAIGPEAKTAIPALRKAAKDNDRELRMNATFAVANIEGWDERK